MLTIFNQSVVKGLEEVANGRTFYELHDKINE